MKYLGWVLLAACLVLAYCHDTKQRGALAIAERRARESDAITVSWKAKYEQASSEADKVDTVWQRQVARVDSIPVPELVVTHDSVVAMPPGYALIDTAKFRAYVTSREEALQTCAQVMLGFRAFRDVADSAITATTVSRDAWKAAYQKAKPTWWHNRIVISAGYGATITGSVIRTGPTVAVGIRLWSL